MRTRNVFLAVAATLLGAILQTAAAAIQLPALDVMDIGADAGAAQSGSVLSFDGTAFQIVTGGAPFDIADTPFTLAAGKLTLAGGTTYVSGPGTLQAGALLSATFASLTVNRIAFGGQTIGTFSADITYTGGSLVGGLTDGRIEGQFSGPGNLDFANGFAAPDLVLKAGATVVPLPAAAWLFGAGLAGLAGLRRRRY